MHKEYIGIFEELIEGKLLQAFSNTEVISFYSTFFDNHKEYSEINDAVCLTVESFLSFEKFKETMKDFKLFDQIYEAPIDFKQFSSEFKTKMSQFE